VYWNQLVKGMLVDGQLEASFPLGKELQLGHWMVLGMFL